MRLRLNLEVRQKPFKAVLLSLLTLALAFFTMWLGDLVLAKPFHYSAKGALVYVLPIVVVVFAMAKIRKGRAPDFSVDGIFTLTRFAWYPIFAAMSLAALTLVSLSPAEIGKPDGNLVFWYIFVTFLGALYEELLCRHFIQGSFKDAFLGKIKPIWIIVLASLVFSLSHLLNLVERPWYVVGVTTQVIYTFALGMALGILYYRTNRLGSVIFVHFLFNLLGSSPDLLTMMPPVASPGALLPDAIDDLPSVEVAARGIDMSLKDSIVAILAMLPAIWFSLVAFRKTRVKRGF